MTTETFKEYVMEQLADMNGITCRPMMGEYLLYRFGLLFGGIYDNRVLIKRTLNNDKFGMPEETPYEGAKPMYMADIDNAELLKEIIEFTCGELPAKKSKRK